MGKIDVESNNNKIVVTEDGWLRLGIGNFDKQVLSAKVTIDGSNNPLQATVNGGEPISANIDARLAANADLTANIGGTETPIKLAPLKIEFDRVQIKPNIEIKFSLFGIPICTIRILGNTDFHTTPE